MAAEAYSQLQQQGDRSVVDQLDGHRRAGLRVLAGGYLGSSNFSVLSSCLKQRRGISWHTYVFLSRLSKAVSLAESRLGNLPASRMFSPYIYAISRAE